MPKRITITLDDETATRLERERIREDRPESNMALRLIKEALEIRSQRA